MEKNKLLSIVLVGRNDNYGGNFKNRLQIAVNYFVHNAEQIGYLERCEIIFADWASEIPMSKALTLSPAAAKITRFLYVNQKQASIKQCPGKNNNFNSTVGINSALRRANGDFHVMMPADILLTRWSLKNFLDILSKKTTVPFKATENVLLIKRYFIPWQFREENKTFAEIDNYLALATQFLASSPLHPGLGMDAGMICHHRDITFEVGGYDESMGGWGKSDTNFCLRAGRKYPLLNLSGFGVHCYDFEPNSITIKNKIRKQNKTKNIAINELNQSWGLNGTNLNEQQCEIVEDYQPNQTSRSLNRQVVSDLMTERSAKETVRSLSFNNIVVEPSYYFISWHIRNFFSDTFVEFLPSDVRQSSKLKMPECAADPCGAATVVSTMNPTATICSIFAESKKTKNHHDHKILAKQYVNKHGGRLSFINTLLLEIFPPNTHIHKWMRGFAHQFHKGIVRLVTGSDADIVDRLGRHLTPYRKIDICLINQDSVESPALITKQIWPLLKMNGIVLCQSATSSESAEYSQAVCRELENCQAMILSTMVILVKGAPAGIWETLKAQETALSKRFKRRTRPFAYLKSHAFDTMRRIAFRG